MPTMRLFIAIPIEEKLKRKILEFQTEISKRIDNFKWSGVNTFHLTLKFIGEVDLNLVTQICKKSEQLAKDIHPMQLVLKSLGYFGSTNNPRVVWLGVDGDVEVLTDTANKFSNAMQEFGITPEAKKYSPHLTLARAKRSVIAEQVHQVIEEFGEIVIGKFVADKIIVYQSELKAEGAEHHPIKTIPLI